MKHCARLPLVLTAAFAIALSSCSSDSNDNGSTTTSGSGQSGGTVGSTENITETNIPIPATTRVLVASDPGGASQTDLSAATYQIHLFWSSPNGQSFNELLGTGFAVGGDLIATNAHVSAEILNRARRYAQFNFSLVKASAFRAETGAEVVLLEALVHPSYSNSTRSPDIGLFVARSTLPVALKLATNSEVSQIRAGNEINLNGFPGDVYNLIFARGFMPGLSIPQATLFTGNIQSLQKFDERSVIDQSNPLSIDMIQHSMDTSGGTSGSPVLNNGVVVAVHNSGLQLSLANLQPDGTPQPVTVTQATASWGVHVKHLRNLLAEYDTGVMEADKRYRLPPPPELVTTAGNQNTGGTTAVTINTGSLTATISNPQNSDVTHQIQLTVDANANVTGTSSWPESTSSGLGDRQFTLSGTIDSSGKMEFTDNTPEIVPGFRRGLYIGNVNAASGSVIGEYHEVDDSDQLFYFGDWSGQIQ